MQLIIVLLISILFCNEIILNKFRVQWTRELFHLSYCIIPQYIFFLFFIISAGRTTHHFIKKVFFLPDLRHQLWPLPSRYVPASDIFTKEKKNFMLLLLILTYFRYGVYSNILQIQTIK